MASKTSVAVLGTGIMGAAMARNLARAGHDVRVWNRTRAKAQALAADGARVGDTPAEAVYGADVVLTILFDAQAALDAMQQAVPALREGVIWVQSTTAGLDALPTYAAFAREHGLLFVDAPVLGSRQPAENGQLQVFAAGPEQARAPLAPVFDAVGSRTAWVGDDGAEGAATRLKLVCNNWVLTVVHGVAETMGLAAGLNVDPKDFLDAVAGGGLDMGYLRMKAASISSSDYTPSFSVASAEKDAQLILSAAEQAGVQLDVAAAGLERFRRAVAQGHEDKDLIASYFAGFGD